jgi:ribosomal protein RSM22 (predicted rRNA methylase)
MQLPEDIRAKLEQFAERVPLPQLRAAADRLSGAYRSDAPQSVFDSEAARIAYLLVRMPATYAACAMVFRYCAELMPEFAPESLLDLGSGPGTAIIAARAQFPSLRTAITIERDRELAKLGGEIISSDLSVRRLGNDLVATELPETDMVVASYALGELSSTHRAEVVERAWKATRHLFVAVEPGTPEGYARVLSVRAQLLAAGAQIVAPCPHAERCPMKGTRDWCHFAARLERTSLHRQVKGGELGHEDEKYSYVSFVKQRVSLPTARIVRHPQQRGGHIQLQLCIDEEGIREEMVTRSQKKLYKGARRAKWGDVWPPTYTESDGE